MEKIAEPSPAEILEIWHEYHRTRVDYVGAGALTGDKYAQLRERTRRFPMVYIT